MRACVHRYIHTYICPYVCMYVRAYARAHTHARTHARTHALTPHARRHARTHARKHARTLARTHVITYERTYVRTCVRTYVHTCLMLWMNLVSILRISSVASNGLHTAWSSETANVIKLSLQWMTYASHQRIFCELMVPGGTVSHHSRKDCNLAQELHQNNAVLWLR